MKKMSKIFEILSSFTAYKQKEKCHAQWQIYFSRKFDDVSIFTRHILNEMQRANMNE